MTLFGRVIQRSHSILALGHHGHAMHDEEPGHIHTTTLWTRDVVESSCHRSGRLRPRRAR